MRRDPRRGPLIAACCRLAAARKVQPGMAASLLGNCFADNASASASSSVVVQEHDPWSDTAALQDLAMRCLERFSPIVALEPLAEQPWATQRLHQPQALLLDVTGVDHLFGGEEGLIREVQRQFHAWGLRVRLALAGTPGAAWALAHYRARNGEPVCTPRGDDLTALESLPTAALRLPTEIVETLQRLGIETIAQLRQLPREGLLRRFDEILLRRLDQALGTVAEPVVTLQLQLPESVRVDLDCPTHHRELIDRAVQSLLVDILEGLRQRQVGALRVRCRLGLEEHAPLELELGLFAPTTDAVHVGRLLGEGLSRRSLRSDVKSVEVTVTLTGSLGERQMEFLAGSATPHAAGGHLARLLDQLSGRIGRMQVLGVKLRAEHQPELAYECFPLTGQAKPLSKARTPGKRSRPLAQPKTRTFADRPTRWWGPAPTEPVRRPLELWATPQPIEMTCGSGEPTLERFHWRGSWYKIVRCWGPERIETGWWRGPSVRRLYYRVETERGEWWWLFQDLQDQRWFLHGVFA